MRVGKQYILLIVLLSVSMAVMTPTSASAVAVPLSAELTGSQETPPTPSMATGTANMVYNTTTKTFDLTADVTGISISRLTESHIHLGAPGVAGPVIVNLDGPQDWIALSDNRIERIIINMVFPAECEHQLLSGNTYINIHTLQFPEGEIRGQLMPKNVPPAIPDASTLIYGAIASVSGFLALRRRRV